MHFFLLGLFNVCLSAPTPWPTVDGVLFKEVENVAGHSLAEPAAATAANIPSHSLDLTTGIHRAGASSLEAQLQTPDEHPMLWSLAKIQQRDLLAKDGVGYYYLEQHHLSIKLKVVRGKLYFETASKKPKLVEIPASLLKQKDLNPVFFDQWLIIQYYKTK